MKSFPPATRGDPIRRHLTADWINTLNTLINPDEAPTPGEVSGGIVAPRFALVRVDSNLSGIGVYRGSLNAQPSRVVGGSENTSAANWLPDHLVDCAIVNWGDSTGHDLPAGQTMPAIRSGCINIDGTRLLPAYHVGGVGSLPSGEFQFMVWQMVSDNQAGWDFVRSHPAL